MADDVTAARERAVRVVRARALDLGMRTWNALADRANISSETLRTWRNGAASREGSIDGIERALQWEPGSIAAIEAGGEPAERRSTDQVIASIDSLQQQTEAAMPSDGEFYARVAQILRDPKGRRYLDLHLEYIEGAIKGQASAQ